MQASAQALANVKCIAAFLGLGPFVVVFCLPQAVCGCARIVFQQFNCNQFIIL